MKKGLLETWEKSPPSPVTAAKSIPFVRSIPSEPILRSPCRGRDPQGRAQNRPDVQRFHDFTYLWPEISHSPAMIPTWKMVSLHCSHDRNSLTGALDDLAEGIGSIMKREASMYSGKARSRAGTRQALAHLEGFGRNGHCPRAVPSCTLHMVTLSHQH